MRRWARTPVSSLVRQASACPTAWPMVRLGGPPYGLVMIIPLVWFGAVLSDGWRGRVVTASGWQGEHEQEGQPEDAHLEPQRVLDGGGESPGAGPDGEPVDASALSGRQWQDLGIGTRRITSMANDT